MPLFAASAVGKTNVASPKQYMHSLKQDVVLIARTSRRSCMTSQRFETEGESYKNNEKEKTCKFATIFFAVYTYGHIFFFLSSQIIVRK